MTDTEIKQRIANIPGNQKDFPASISKTSFGNARKYYRFMDKIELEFGICFSYDDLDKTYTLDALTQKVTERLGKQKSNTALLKQRTEIKYWYIFEIFLAILAVMVFAWRGVHWLSISLAVVALLIIYWLVSSKQYNRQHNKKLALRMNTGK